MLGSKKFGRRRPEMGLGRHGAKFSDSDDDSQSQSEAKGNGFCFGSCIVDQISMLHVSA